MGKRAEPALKVGGASSNPAVHLVGLRASAAGGPGFHSWTGKFLVRASQKKKQNSNVGLFDSEIPGIQAHMGHSFQFPYSGFPA